MYQSLDTRLLLGRIRSLLVKSQCGLISPVVADPKLVPELDLANSDVSQQTEVFDASSNRSIIYCRISCTSLTGLR